VLVDLELVVVRRSSHLAPVTLMADLADLAVVEAALSKVELVQVTVAMVVPATALLFIQKVTEQARTV
jgi:hypothetical protein